MIPASVNEQVSTPPALDREMTKRKLRTDDAAKEQERREGGELNVNAKAEHRARPGSRTRLSPESSHAHFSTKKWINWFVSAPGFDEIE
jgi:hypothetical protein